MSSEDVADVIVVGAGPVGSMAALLADRLGLSVVLVDASTEVYPKPRAIHFDADIMRIFQFAGLADELEPRVRATSGALHLGEDGEPIRDFRVVATEGDLGWKPHYMFYQPEVDRMLRRRAEDAPGIHTAFGWSCRSIAELDDHVVVELGNESGEVRIERARYVIAADGSTSTIRKSLGIELTDYGFDEPWIVIDADADSDELGPDYSIMYCDPQRPATYVPGPRTHRRWEFMVLPGEDSSTLAEPEVALSLIRQVTPWYDDGRLIISRAAVYRFHALVADRWRQGRILLAGDAAHQTPPFYGQGMCHGMRDVRNLAWKLRAVLRDGVPDELLDSYQVEREPHVRAIIEQSVANGRYICVLDVDEAKVRDARMRELMENPAPQAPEDVERPHSRAVLRCARRDRIVARDRAAVPAAVGDGIRRTPRSSGRHRGRRLGADHHGAVRRPGSERPAGVRRRGRRHRRQRNAAGVALRVRRGIRAPSARPLRVRRRERCRGNACVAGCP